MPGYDPIPAGATLERARLPAELSVRANTQPGRVGSVAFALDGIYLRTENYVPYAVAGDFADGASYYPWALPETGEHTLSATPYTAPQRGGTAGEAFTLRFTLESGASIQRVTFSASDENFPNPERGFHIPTNPPLCGCPDVASFEVSAAGWTPPLDEATAKAERIGQGVTLRSVRYTIAAFRTTDLSPDFLARVRRDFAAARRAGVKLQVRFSYGYEGPRPDAPKDKILRHLAQLKPVLMENNDVLAFVDAGFVGHYGEWHDSTSGNLVGRYGDVGPAAREILDGLFAAVPQDRMVVMRYTLHKSQYFHKDFYVPGGRSAWEDATPMPRSEDAYSGSNESRAGNQNDSFHADRFDGTYGYDDATLARHKTRTAQENLYVVQSGEIDAGLGDSRNVATSERMLREGARMHWSSLNAYDGYYGDDAGVIQRWKDDGVYERIARSLGYRFRLLGAEVPARAWRGGELRVVLELANDGWARPYNPRDLELVLRSKGTGAVTRLKVATQQDTRLFLPGPAETKRLELPVSLPANLPAGDYDLLLNLPDPYASINERPEYSIRLANESTWESETGYNHLNASLRLR